MQKTQKGFSLIELLVVIAIIGILAGIAIPMYSHYRDNAYRAAAKTALVEGAQNMERYFTRNNTYAGATIGNVAAGAQVAATTEGGTYTLQFANANTNGSNADISTFILQAVPAGSQVGDSCGTLGLNQLGVKTAAQTDCW